MMLTRWPAPPQLAVGDEVLVRIIEASNVDRLLGPTATIESLSRREENTTTTEAEYGSE
jgi:hypothetical protein